MRLARDGAVDVACGVLQDASYPTLPAPASAGAAVALGTIGAGASAPAAFDNGDEEGVEGSASAQDCGGGTAVFPTSACVCSNLFLTHLPACLTINGDAHKRLTLFVPPSLPYVYVCMQSVSAQRMCRRTRPLRSTLRCGRKETHTWLI